MATESIVTRIVELEQQCAREIEEAEADSRRAIESHRKDLEEQKARQFDLIAAEVDEQCRLAVAEAQRRAEEELESARNALEKLLQNPVLHREIEERIVSMLFAD